MDLYRHLQDYLYGYSMRNAGSVANCLQNTGSQPLERLTEPVGVLPPGSDDRAYGFRLLWGDLRD